MQSKSHHTGSKPTREHGTMKSYVTGFALSLICTIIPYYLVVEHIVKGDAVLAIILEFAVVQMIIQITFFLHLGREPKPHWNLGFFISTVGIILVVVGGSIFIMHNLHYNMSPITATEATKKLVDDEAIYQIGGEKTGACQQIYANHKVTIKDGKISPATTTANRCDTLTFINDDKGTRDIAFGVHPHHETYAGQAIVAVSKERPETVTLSQSGTHQFHDILHEQTHGSFTVKP